MAQGAAQCIEDGMILSRCLVGRAGDPAAALRLYEEMRRERTARTQLGSRRNAELFHAADPDAVRRRDASIQADAVSDRHGYAIIKDIEDRTDRQLSVRSGALYTVIQRLLEVGLVGNAPAPVPDGGPTTDQRRKYYRITKLGRQVAALEGARLARMVEAAHQRRLLPEREVR